MFNPIAGAYYILSKVKENYPEIRETFFNTKEGKHLMKEFAKAPQSKYDRDYVYKINMGVPIVTGDDVRGRQAILSLNDAFQLVAVWDWLQRLSTGLDTDVYDEEVNYMGSVLGDLIKRVDAHDTRRLSTGIGFSYFSNRHKCYDFLETVAPITGPEASYLLRVNLVIKYYLGMEPIFDLGESK